MIKGKTSSGFEFSVEEHILDDMELVEAIVEMDENPAVIIKVIKMILPGDQRKKLYDHLRTERGNVPILAVAQAVAEIFNCNQKGKN